jgi:hypothetical protein
MPVVNVGRVSVVMDQALVSMEMGMWLDAFITGVNVLMVLVVHVAMFVQQWFMDMRMGMAIGEEADRSPCHRESCKADLPRERITHPDREQCTDEWRNPEPSRRTGGRESPLRVRVTDDARAVADSSDAERGDERGRRRNPEVSREGGNPQRDGSGGKTFPGRDCERIAQGDALDHVVVERPTQACRKDQEHSDVRCSARQLCVIKRKGKASDRNEHRRESRTHSHLIAKEDRGDGDGEQQFRVQKEGYGGRAGLCESHQEQPRSRDTAAEDRARKPAIVASSERRFDTPLATQSNQADE